MSVPCYDGNGEQGTDIPCGFSSSNQCCGSGWDCLENGLCQKHGTTAFSQGTCTSPQFDLCLSFCNKSEFEGATEVSSCGINSWCCAGQAGLSGGPDCCDSSTTTTLFPYPYSTIAADQVGQTSVTISSTSSFSTTTSSTSTTNTASSSISSISSAVSSQSTSLASTSSATSTPTVAPIDSDLSTGEKAGIGVAVPLGLLLLGALVFFIWKSRRQERYLKTLQHGSEIEIEARSDGVVMGEVGHKTYTPELDDERQYNVPELGGNARHEMSGSGRYDIPFDSQCCDMSYTGQSRSRADVCHIIKMRTTISEGRLPNENRGVGDVMRSRLEYSTLRLHDQQSIEQYPARIL
nr:hypothetical protein CFP56_00489 [Quercus suber]